jgi:hypothetical protein
MKAKARNMTKIRKTSPPKDQAAQIGRALRRAAQDARKGARMHGTPLYVWENGKVVATKP